MDNPLKPEAVEGSVAQYAKFIGSARWSIVFFIGFTLLNCLMIDGNQYYLVSCAFSWVNWALYYLGIRRSGLILAIIGLVAFGACWYVSKKDHRAFLVAAALVGFDLIYALSWGTEIFGGADLFFHALLIVWLAMGYVGGRGLLRLADEAAVQKESKTLPDSELPAPQDEA